MVIVHDTEKYKYFDKQRKVELIQYSNVVKNIYEKKRSIYRDEFTKLRK